MKNLIFSVAAALVPAPTMTACPTHGSVSTASTLPILPTATALAATDTPILKLSKQHCALTFMPVASLRAAIGHCSGTMHCVNKSLAAMPDVWFDYGLKCMYI